jgi:hypothetical protein
MIYSHINPLEIQLGSGLLSIVDNKENSKFVQEIHKLRKKFNFPKIRIIDNIQLAENEYNLLSFGRQVVKKTIKSLNNFDNIIISIEEYIATDEFKANLVEYQKNSKEKENENTKNYALQNNKIKIKDVLYHLWHGALVDRIVENIGYVYTLPQSGLNINDLLEREIENYSFRNLLDCLVITEKGKTYEECENKLKEKLSKNTFLIIGKNKKYLGLWPFRAKGMEVLVFIYKDEGRNEGDSEVGFSIRRIFSM